MAKLVGVLERCGPKLMGKELANWGGWWRNRYREDAGKAERVLAEIGSMIREGRVLRNPGAAAMDLWKRFAPSE